MTRARQLLPWLAVVLLVLWQGTDALLRPLWLDEAIQAVVSSAPDRWHQLGAHDMHPPLLSWMLGPILVLSPTELALRLPSYLAWLATLPAMAWAAHTWEQPRAALPAALLVAASPHLVFYATEGRPYALAVLLVTLALALVPTRHTGPLTVVLTLAVLSQYGTWPLVLVAGTLHAWRQPGAPRVRWLPLALAALTMVALLVTLVPSQRAAQGQGLTEGALAAWMWTPTTLVPWLWQGLLGFAGWSATGSYARIAPWFGLGVVALWGLLARRGVRDPLSALAFVPLFGLVVAAGLSLYPLGPTRHALVLVPALILWTVTRVHRARWWAAVAVLPLLVLSRWGAPAPSEEHVQALVDGLDAPVVLDASTAFAADWYGIDGPRLPWVRGARLSQALDTAAPSGRFWLVVGQPRFDISADVRRWARRAHRRTGDVRTAPGVWALPMDPAP